MEPFTIICDTCNSRIRVRNPALLGHLVNCPKCDSMVLVALPAPTPPASSPSAPTSPDSAIGPKLTGRDPREAQIEVQRHDRPPVDSAALTQEGLPAELFDAKPHNPLASPPGDDVGGEYRLAPEMPGAEVADSGGWASSPAPPPIQAVDPYAAQADVRSAGADLPASWETESRPHLPSAAWTSDSTTKTRQMLMVGFLGFAGVVLATLMFGGFLRWYAGDNNQPGGNSVASSAVPSPDDVLPPQPGDNPDAGPVANGAEQAAADQNGVDPAAVEDSLVDSAPKAALTADVGPDGTTPTEVEVDVDSADVAVDGSTGRPVAEGVAEVEAENMDEPVDDLVAKAPAMELPKQLQAFGPMLQYEIQPQFSDAMEILSEAPVTAEDLGLTSSAEGDGMPAIDLQAQSQITIPALVVGELPLSHFASLWSNLSGIPTRVDLASLTAAGIDRNQPIGLAMVKSVTLGSLIDQLGAPLGLQAVPHANRFLELVAPAAAMEEHLPPDVSLAGLVDADHEAWLLETLPQLFPLPVAGLSSADTSEVTGSAEASGGSDPPGVPESTDGSPEATDSSPEAASPEAASPEALGDSLRALDDSLEALEGSDASKDSPPAAGGEFLEASSTEAVVWKIEQGRLLRPQTASGGAVDPRIWSAAVHLLESWRNAAGLPKAWTDFDPSLHSADLVAPSEVAGLDFVLQQVQAEARPVAQIVPSICSSAGLQAWIDWPALTSIGLGPQSTDLVLTNARPLRRALADYASKFSLVVAVIDNQSLWITSNHAYRSSPRLYVVPSQGESAEAWVSRLRPLTPVASDGFGVGQVVAIATPDTKFMLVRCCPMQVEFQ